LQRSAAFDARVMKFRGTPASLTNPGMPGLGPGRVAGGPVGPGGAQQPGQLGESGARQPRFAPVRGVGKPFLSPGAGRTRVASVGALQQPRDFRNSLRFLFLDGEDRAPHGWVGRHRTRPGRFEAHQGFFLAAFRRRAALLGEQRGPGGGVRGASAKLSRISSGTVGAGRGHHAALARGGWGGASAVRRSRGRLLLNAG